MSSINQAILGPGGKSSPPPLAYALAGMAALAVAMGIGRFAFTPILPMMLQDAGLTIGSGRWLASANYIGYLIGAVAAMFVRIRIETSIRAGLLAIALTTAAMGLSTMTAAWLALRLLAGIASAWVLISLSAWSLETLAPSRRPFLVGLTFAGVGTGIAGAGLVCIALTAGRAGSALAWQVLGAIALAITALIWRYFATPAASRTAVEHVAGSAFRWNADALRLVCCYGACGFGYIIPATFLPLMAHDALPGSSVFAWSWPLFGATSVVATLTVAKLARRLGNRPLWMLGHCVMALGIALPLWSPGLLAILAAALCVGGSFMTVTLAAMQEAKQVAAGGARALMAAMTAAFALGQILGPLCVATTAGGRADFSSGLILAATLLTVSAGLLFRRTGQS